MPTRPVTQLARLYALERLLLAAPQGLSTLELAARLQVDRRTVYRNLETLCAAGVPVWQSGGKFGIVDGWRLPGYRAREAGLLAAAMAVIREFVYVGSPKTPEQARVWRDWEEVNK